MIQIIIVYHFIHSIFHKIFIGHHLPCTRPCQPLGTSKWSGQTRPLSWWSLYCKKSGEEWRFLVLGGQAFPIRWHLSKYLIEVKNQIIEKKGVPGKITTTTKSKKIPQQAQRICFGIYKEKQKGSVSSIRQELCACCYNCGM